MRLFASAVPALEEVAQIGALLVPSARMIPTSMMEPLLKFAWVPEPSPKNIEFDLVPVICQRERCVRERGRINLVFGVQEDRIVPGLEAETSKGADCLPGSGCGCAADESGVGYLL